MHPGADPAQIRLRYRGADRVSLNAAGQLEVTTPLGGFTDDAPIAWQENAGERTSVKVAYNFRDSSPASGFELLASTPAKQAVQLPASAFPADDAGLSQYPASSFGFSLGPYDRSQALVIDPAVLAYCGYIGGSSQDRGYGIAVDGAGNVYVTGYTDSAQDGFPVTGGPDLTYNGGDNDAFVAEVSASGESLVYAGYIGGSGDERGRGIAVDGAGNAYVLGYTDSTQDSFPVTGGPDLTYNVGRFDAFVAKVVVLEKHIYLPLVVRGN